MVSTNPTEYIDEWWNDINPGEDCSLATAVTVGEGDTISGIDFSLQLGGSLSGRVYESDGTTAISNLQVHARSEACGGGWLGGGTTNELGEYKIHGLPTGNVYVHTRADITGLIYVDERYENVLSWANCDDITPVSINAATDHPNIDFQLALDADDDDMADDWEIDHFDDLSHDGNADLDNDDLADRNEFQNSTDPNDADSDDDGIFDGDEVKIYFTDPSKLDTDGDGIQDGTEIGLTLADIGADTDTVIFHPDLDPLATTNPLRQDTDGDGLMDGEEDLNKNGRTDNGETDPNVKNTNSTKSMPWIPLLLLD